MTSRRGLCDPFLPVSTKRNGSGPPPPPRTQRAATSGRYEWDEPLPRTPAPFPVSDDDGERSDLADSDLLEDADAAADEPEFVDSVLIREVPLTRGAPPPIPAPVPLSSGRAAFIDDGEIALPPPISQLARSQAGRFPFREVEGDDSETSAVRRAAFRDDDDDLRGADLLDDDAAPPVPKTAEMHAEPRDDGPAPLLVERDAPARAEDDFGDLNEPSRAHATAKRAPAAPPAPPPAEDDFGDLNEASRISSVSAALDRSGLAPSLEVSLLDDSLPLPPPPPAALDTDDLPPLIAAATSGQSGVAFTRSDLERSLQEPDLGEPSGAIALASESLRSLRSVAAAPPSPAPVPLSVPPISVPPLSAPPLSVSPVSTPPVVSAPPVSAAPIPSPPPVSAPRPPASPLPPPWTTAPREVDRDDDDSSPSLVAARLAPPPEEPLGEAFPLDLWSDPDELIGRDFGRYRVVKPLSRGQTTRVYAAIDEETQRHVAIRLLGPTHSPTERRSRQFIYEAEQLAKLRHESIVEVLATGTTTDHLSYYVMERLDGETLTAVLRAEGPMSWQQVGILATQICEPLIVAADKGIIASDLHLGSVMRLRDHDDDGRRRQPIKLLHVGVSPVISVFRSGEGNLVESKGTPLGVAELMAPELASGGAPSAASSVYALGVMMYELLTGRPPFRGDSFLAVLKKQMYDEPLRPSVVVPHQEIPEHFEQIVLQALTKDPSRRFPSIRAFHEAILAARAQEGELRRATAILALDPTFWDEKSARNAEPSEIRPVSQPEPQPLATFTADLRQRDPVLAEAVLGASTPPAPRSEPKSAPIPAPKSIPPIPAPKSAPRAAAAPVTPPPKPEPSMILSQLAPAIRAPEPVNLPAPAPAAPPMPIIVLQRPAQVASGNLVRNISLAVVVGVVLIFLYQWSRGPAQPPARKGDAVAGAATRAKDPPTRTKRRDPEPEPVEAKTEPPPPPVETKTEPPPPPVETKTEPKKKPKPPPPDSDLPARIDSGRLKSRYESMEARIAARCSSIPGGKGAKVSVKIVVDTRGVVKATATGTWANTPLGRCVEDFVESIRFNETQHGGSRQHTFSL